MNTIKRFFILFIFLTSLIVFTHLTSTDPLDSSYQFPEPTSIMSKLNFSRIVHHVKYLSSLGTRFTGYSGCDRAAEYIYSVFKGYGLENVHYHNYSLPIPLDCGARLEVYYPEKNTFRIYPALPNVVALSTLPSNGITGELVYVEDGELRSFRGKNVSNAIVLMDYNSGWNWLNAVKLGARAVIFIQPEDTSFKETGSKYFSHAKHPPLNFPRFMISKKNADYLISLLNRGKVKVRLTARMIWKEVVAKNVIGFIRGVEYSEQYIVITSYYDSFSPIPSIAPGAEEACGISILLELARYFSENKPSYTIMFIAFSGHHQGLRGAHAFAQDYFFGDKRDIAKKIILMINLDISTHSSTIAATVYGMRITFGYDTTLKHPGSIYVPMNEYILRIFNELNVRTKGRYSFLNLTSADFGTLKTTLGLRLYSYDSEIFALITAPAWTLTTIYDCRPYVGTPVDTFERINLENLKKQAELILYTSHVIANTPNLREKYLSSFSFEDIISTPFWTHIRGIIAVWNTSKSWYSPASDVLIVLNDVVFFSKNGTFDITGFYPPFKGYSFVISAYKVNPETGSVVYAPDEGVHRYSTGVVIPEVDIDIGYLTIFKCSSLVLFDCIDPDYLNIPEVSHQPNLFLSIYTFETHTNPESFGRVYYLNSHLGISLAMVFVPPHERFEVLVQSAYATKYPLAFIVNATEDTPGGSGLTLREGEQRIVTFTAYEYAKNLFYVDEDRINRIKDYGILDEGVIKAHEHTGELLRKAENAMRAYDYELAYSLALRAWSNERKVYLRVRNVFEDSINTVQFLAFILIPFIFLSERAFFGTKGLKRIIAIVLLFSFPFIALYFLHPGFQLASNIIIVVLGYSVLILTVPIIVIALQIFYSMLVDIRKKVKGLHFAEISRSSAAVMAFSVGLQNLKKRKLRTTLTIFSLILSIVGLTLFTSLTPLSFTRAVAQGRTPTYVGVMIKRSEWGHVSMGVGEYVEHVLKDSHEDLVIAKRAWMYPVVYTASGPVYFEITHDNRKAYVYVFMGLTPEEKEVTRIDAILLPGSRWFKYGDKRVCILPSTLRETLGVKVGDEVSIFGLDMRVIGFFDEKKLADIKDLDGESITPVNIWVTPNPWNVHISPELVIIVPYKDAVEMGGLISSVAAIFKESRVVKERAEMFAKYFTGLYTFSGWEDNVYLLSRVTTVTLMGWEFQVIPTIIVCITILMIMIDSVYGRQKEILIYSVVGLSPLHVSFMFLAESMIYAILGGVLGYILAIAIGRLTMLFYPMTFNVSSIWVINSIGIAMLIVIASSVFPALKASRLVTPSLERVWKMPTKPIGDQWNIPLPFRIPSRELRGVIAYLIEFIELHRERGLGTFRVLDYRYEEGVGYKRLVLIMHIKPYELGIRQEMVINITPDPKVTDRWMFNVYVRRLSGPRKEWISTNRVVVDSFRKQMLIWRSLSPKEKLLYISKFKGGS